MKSLNFNRNTTKGFSLIELLLVLGVLAILLVAAFVVYPQVRDRNQANAEVSNLTTIKANINNLFASRGGNYSDLDEGVANQARAIPTSMNGGDFPAAAPITSSWGASVSITPTTYNGNANRAFEITYANVPEGVCLGLVSGAGGNFVDIEVGGATVFNDNVFDPVAATTRCAENDGNVPVTFISN